MKRFFLENEAEKCLFSTLERISILVHFWLCQTAKKWWRGWLRWGLHVYKCADEFSFHEERTDLHNGLKNVQILTQASKYDVFCFRNHKVSISLKKSEKCQDGVYFRLFRFSL